MDYNARYYSSVLGRFISPDTQVHNYRLDQNRYTYVRNNPLIYNDPSGHQSLVEIAVGTILLAGITYGSYKLATDENWRNATGELVYSAGKGLEHTYEELLREVFPAPEEQAIEDTLNQDLTDTGSSVTTTETFPDTKEVEDFTIGTFVKNLLIPPIFTAKNSQQGDIDRTNAEFNKLPKDFNREQGRVRSGAPNPVPGQEKVTNPVSNSDMDGLNELIDQAADDPNEPTWKRWTIRILSGLGRGPFGAPPSGGGG